VVRGKVGGEWLRLRRKPMIPFVRGIVGVGVGVGVVVVRVIFIIAFISFLFVFPPVIFFISLFGVLLMRRWELTLLSLSFDR
jgi:hypothetical protein